MSKPPRLTLGLGRLFLGSILVALIGLSFYLPRLSTSHQGALSYELTSAAQTRGLIHAPGYPLYTAASLWLNKFFPDQILTALAAFSALCQCLAGAGLFIIIYASLNLFWVAFFLALAWLLFDSTISTGTDLGLLPLHHLWVVLLAGFALMLRHQQLHPLRAAAVLGLGFGLAACHHQAIWLWLPLLIGALWSLRQAPSQTFDWDSNPLGPDLSQSFAKLLFVSTIAILIGLSPYLGLLRLGGNLEALPLKHLSELWEYTLKLDPELSVVLTPQLQGGLDNLKNFFQISLWQAPVFLIGAAGSIFLLFIGRQPVAFGLAVSVIAHLWFAARLQTSASGGMINPVVANYYPLILLAFAFGLSETLAQIKYARLIQLLLILLCAGFMPWQLQKSLDSGDPSADLTVSLELDQIFRELPEQAVFLSASDRTTKGILYRQIINSERPDIAIIPVSSLNDFDSTAQLRKKYAFLSSLPSQPTLTDLARLLSASGKLVFSSQSVSPPLGFLSRPLGITWQWIAEEKAPKTVEVEGQVLGFCINLPEGLDKIDRARAHSRYIISHSFMGPLRDLAQSTNDPSLANILNEALDKFYRGDLAGARENCRLQLQKLKRQPKPWPTPYR